jgi:hypothetical protein
MSSGNREGEESERKPSSFAKSIIKALSGSRFMTPVGSERNSPITTEQGTKQIHREFDPGPGLRDSSDEMRYGGEDRDLPMNEREKLLRVSDTNFSILGDSPETHKLLGVPLGQSGLPRGAGLLEERSTFGLQPSLPSHELGMGMGPIVDENRELEMMRDLSSMPPFQPLSTHIFSRPTERIGVELDSHPYFSRNVGSERLDESASVRVGHQHLQNITRRDAKRPKERPRDKAYKQRFSNVSSADMAEHRSNLVFRAEMGDGRGGRDPRLTPAPSDIGPMRESGPSRSPLFNVGRSRGPNTPGEIPFEIYLTSAGTKAVHRVWDSMLIWQLTVEAGSIFGIEPDEISLILFSGSPTSLQRNGRISGPPRVTPGATVMVFQIPALRAFVPPPVIPQVFRQDQFSDPPLPALSTKLLATFKLPKFDGAVKSWKQWEKSFQRFLGIHQLDHVLEESFPDILWITPGAKAANKMVYFLVEDAVAPGTLGSRLVRQATKWNGHEAFVLLRNGYVFNGPQSATILLAELSKIRLKRDEDASTFCFRLVELIEDLELIPGEAAVYLTDTQKLSYLLSAIRHETSLQAVYSQLQSEQLRGTISFDLACQELHHRVEAMRADDYLDSRPGRALVSTTGKTRGLTDANLVKVPCLAKDCAEQVQPYLPLCKLCYLQCMAGKIPSLVLRDNLGNAIFNSKTQILDFPASVPQSRFPKKGLKKGKKMLVAGARFHDHQFSSGAGDRVSDTSN